jgi:transcriptional regulator with XRE-family HTH domain
MKKIDEDVRGVCKRLRSVRQALGASQNKFAEKTGLSVAAICRIEHEQRNFSTKTLITILKNANISSEYILFGKGEMFVEER